MVFVDKNVEFQRFPKNIFIGDNAVIKEGTQICSCNENAVVKISKNTTIDFHNFIFARKELIN